MHIVVCSAKGITDTDYSIPAWDHMRELGHTVDFYKANQIPVGTKPDALISMSVSMMEETYKIVDKYPNVPLFCYNWDCYEWVWSNPRPGEYDYVRYGKLLEHATEVWVPSACTGRRTKQWWGLDNWRVILSACPYWEHDNVRDGGYALCTLREIPDPQWDWFERACKELNIPYRMTMHECSFKEYQEAVASCRFLVSHCYELSTGGLTLMEGYYLGKPSLLSDSPWHGGVDYMGNRATYFDHTSYENFKFKLENMWVDHPTVSTEARQYIPNNFQDSRLIDDMEYALRRYIK